MSAGQYLYKRFVLPSQKLVEVRKVEEGLRPLVVELDGHAFHDKDKRQRSYEKARDRYLVQQGLRVLHFTGSDVVADPHKVAYEVLEMLGVYSGSFRKYNPADPLGQEE